MKRIHVMAEHASALFFVITGQLMRLYDPPIPEVRAELRLMLMCISRPIYLVSAPLVNFMLRLYLRKWSSGRQHAINRRLGPLLRRSNRTTLKFVNSG